MKKADEKRLITKFILIHMQPEVKDSIARASRIGTDLMSEDHQCHSEQAENGCAPRVKHTPAHPMKNRISTYRRKLILPLSNPLPENALPHLSLSLDIFLTLGILVWEKKGQKKKNPVF